MNLMESQWKLRQQHDLNFPMEGKPLQNKYYCQKKEIDLKKQDCENLDCGIVGLWDWSRKANHLRKVI